MKNWYQNRNEKELILHPKKKHASFRTPLKKIRACISAQFFFNMKYGAVFFVSNEVIVDIR